MKSVVEYGIKGHWNWRIGKEEEENPNPNEKKIEDGRRDYERGDEREEK